MGSKRRSEGRDTMQDARRTGRAGCGARGAGEGWAGAAAPPAGQWTKSQIRTRTKAGTPSSQARI
ncbi:hypothetical protein CBM2586_B40144 [Cupriavidus phytorum]|uniref:Uncharacterized protein n=1 Tax=Cupriavidus taiwanensis TaxID=164546 RepID=A0A375CLA7_9BURK|nr:hypothetical protein CBM2586_B40144 [Cupriavidus taiwanensis]